LAVKSPINWYGGKYYMANKIINIFPEHKIFVEVFGGAGHIIFKKERSDIEIYNDIHEGLYLLFKLLRDKDKSEELIRQIQLTPYSRKEFMNSKYSWIDEEDELEKVRKFYASTMQAVGANGGWCYAKSKSRRGMSQAVSRWLGNVDENLIDVIERLRELQIENLDFEEVIKKYDREDTLFYLDPPYITETRKLKKGYQHEMTDEDHMRLVDVLLNIKGKAILSGYNHEIYNKLLDNGWELIELGSFAKRSMKNSGDKLERGKELVWVNFEIN
jgi:DNA adenine methylase